MKLALLAAVSALLAFPASASEFTLLKLSAAVTLANQASVAVPWVSEADNLGVFDSGQPTRVTFSAAAIAANGNSARLCYGAVFSGTLSDSTTLRQVWARKNGSEYPIGYFSHTASGGYPNGSSVSFTGCGPWFGVSAGDYWEYFAYQASGSAMKFGHKVGTSNSPVNSAWFMVEMR